MSPPLLEPGVPPSPTTTARKTQQSHSFNGEFSLPLPLNSSGYPSKSHFVPMNPSNFSNQTSGFSNSNQNDPNFGFNTPSFPQSNSGPSRPRFLKVRRQSNSQNLRPNIPGFNPFRPGSENLVSGLGSGGNEAFMFGENRDDLGVNLNPLKWDSSGGLEKGVIEEMGNLRIGSGDEFVNSRQSSSLSGRLESGGFVFGSGYKKGSSIDESMASELPENLKKLNIEGSGNGERIEKIRDGRFNVSVVDKTKFGFGSGDNVGSSFDSSAGAELPNELMSKLNIKEAGHFDANDTNVFVFGSRKKGDDSFAGSSVNALPDQLKSLNIKETLNTKSFEKNEVNIRTNEKENTVLGTSKSTSGLYDGRKEALLSKKMEKLKVGSGAGDSVSDAGPSSSREFVKEMQTGHFSDKLFHDLDKSVPTEFTFQLGMQSKDASGSQAPFNEPKDDTKLGGNVSSPSSFSSSDMGFPPAGSAFERPMAEFSFASKQDGIGTPFVEFKTPKPKANIFSGMNQKMEFSAKRESTRDSRVKKMSGKLKNPTPVKLWPGQNFVSKESDSQENPEPSESYSPMDISPYQETLPDNRCSRENSVTSDESFSLDNGYGASDSAPTVSSDAIDEDLIIATQCLDMNDGDSICQEAKVGDSEYHSYGSVGAGDLQEDSASGVETESFKSAAEEVDFNIDVAVTSAEAEASPSLNIERHDSDGRMHIGIASSSEDIIGSNFTFAASSAAQGQLSALKRHQKKKNLLKVGHDMYDSTLNAKVSYASSSVNLFPLSGTSLPSSPGRVQKGDLSTSQSKVKTDLEPDKTPEIKQESAASVASQEACEKWRLRGNQAYKHGDLSKAEDCYTEGVNCVSTSETSRSCLRALMLCYSNRAATRMSLGRLRDALGDCVKAAAIDPNFLRVQLRAANCYLDLGEVEDASKYFKRCLPLGSDICVDRNIAVEASDGLQKAQKVSVCMNRCAELMQRSTSNDAETALEVIAEALTLSSFSEKLLEMKANALFVLRRYDEVIQLCDQTLGSAEKNSPPVEASALERSLDGSEILENYYFRLWRCRLIFKSYFHLGRLEEGIAFLEEQQDKVSVTNRNGSKALESLIPLAGTVRELLRHKAAGNEAFQAGRHAEAVEHYTTALSCNVAPRPFAAVCFCNRAAAYKASGQITDAIADCSLAIALDGNYLKAISRRATLYEMIRDYGQAASDLQRLVSILTKQVEERTNQSGAVDRSNSCANDLRHARLRLAEIEEEARKEIPLDMYLILGIGPSVSASDIKKAYRKAALKHHPDKASQSLAKSDNGDDKLWKAIAAEVHKDADKLFKMIGEAYAVLSDSIKRSRYDAEEEMRNAQKKRTGSSTSRAQTDAQYHSFETSSSRRHWREVWRSYGNSSSRGSEGTRVGRYS
ncbi:hypothetical protein ACB098_08G161200 [Castanea mollissima]